jgi:hypothetical protein
MGVVGQRDAPAILTREIDAVLIVQEAAWVPRLVWTGAENLAPLPEFQPVAGRYTD